MTNINVDIDIPNMNIIVDKSKGNVRINVDINEGALWSMNFTPFSILLNLISTY